MSGKVRSPRSTHRYAMNTHELADALEVFDRHERIEACEALLHGQGPEAEAEIRSHMSADPVLAELATLCRPMEDAVKTRMVSQLQARLQNGSHSARRRNPRLTYGLAVGCAVLTVLLFCLWYWVDVTRTPVPLFVLAQLTDRETAMRDAGNDAARPGQHAPVTLHSCVDVALRASTKYEHTPSIAAYFVNAQGTRIEWPLDWDRTESLLRVRGGCSKPPAQLTDGEWQLLLVVGKHSNLPSEQLTWRPDEANVASTEASGDGRWQLLRIRLSFLRQTPPGSLPPRPKEPGP